MSQTHQEYQELVDLSTIMGEGLQMAATDELPGEIAEAMKLAQVESRHIAKALQDLTLARQEFSSLDQALDRLFELADEAAGLDASDQAGREMRHNEFARLAHVVAHLAGRAGYLGPRLSLLGQPEAQAAKKALRHLLPLKRALGARLAEQEANIFKAIEATLEFIKAVNLAYPQALSGAPADLLAAAESGMFNPIQSHASLQSKTKLN